MKRGVWRAAAATAFICGSYTAGTTLFMRLTGAGIVRRAAAGTGIILTFDDGPNPLYTPKLLDLLGEYGVKAIFFVVGRHAEQHPELLRRMQREGHLIGIHHYHHRSAWRLTPRQTKREIRRTAAVIERITGNKPHFYRPPYGKLNAAVPFVSDPFITVIWTHILGDWKVRTCDRDLLGRMMAVPADGSVVVLHDDGSNKGADDAAPGHMLPVLRQYLGHCREHGIELLHPGSLVNDSRGVRI
ncbi:polysaccharide deacetylase familiy protein [Sporosarcina sp. NCCP-2716]|uniref:polysaccharide deacetylase family protein n=1 Tax=Sporosarcina sp. NCCP-2716 TaxID=2943679 RepID=UPI00203F31E3|nr:polysaccharide deacetylase family protein [Sporosarcina sp. NCCP-2716]GKV69262.1 polysaccharide deacetylase familiy protein [Sporosarcina sp. NCCP-2716]